MITTLPRLHLPIPQDVLTKYWQESADSFSREGNRWLGWLNQACLESLLPWVQAEYIPQARMWTNRASLASYWEVVDGCAIECSGMRLVLIPTTAIDFAELRVPQEWVDIPSWAGDYYLSVYVNPEEGEVEVVGYTTHQQLKEQGEYDSHDRSYSVDGEDLLGDLNVLWLSRQLCADEVLRFPLTALPQIPLEQAENLLNRLGDASVIRPRLAIPFTLWGALLEHDGWRQRLYQHRLGLPEQWSMAQWFQTGVSNLAQQFGWDTMVMQPSLLLSRGTETVNNKVLCRQLSIAGQTYDLRVFPTGDNVWRFELQSTSGKSIPAGFKLRLLTEDLMPFTNNEDIAIGQTERLYLEVHLTPGDGLVWETEPLPANYDREILRF
jgi:Protein of unknown function (DUF1822)